MGLDITAYSNLKHIGTHEKDPALNEGESGGVDDWCYYEEHVHAFAYDAFPASFRGIPIISNSESTNGRYTFLEGGCFAIADRTQIHGFHAGSYGGYNVWREDLQRQFNPDRKPDLPFYELIWFADNEGTIGPEAAAELLVDFRSHADRYMPEMAWAHYARERYRDWTRAFELAAEHGLVAFH